LIAFDLQSHSTASDGALPPAEVVRAAAAAGVELLALTDHDTVAGVEEAIAAGREAGVEIVPAVELSAVDGEHEELHVLGYGIDHRDPRLLATLEDLRGDRERRILAMAAALRADGLALDDAELEARRSRGEPLGRPHLARAILDHPANARRLAAEGIAGPNELFPRYLVPGAATYVGRTRPTVEQAIALIHEAGGRAVWAHPFWDLDASAEVEASLRRYAALGLDGVEAFYPTHGPEQVRLLTALAGELGFSLVTGSADFHGPQHGTFPSFLGFETHGHAPRLDALRDDGRPDPLSMV
jgi:3',5'-nucleoside bisphosphate phosphatase